MVTIGYVGQQVMGRGHEGQVGAVADFHFQCQVLGHLLAIEKTI